MHPHKTSKITYLNDKTLDLEYTVYFPLQFAKVDIGQIVARTD